MTKKPAKKAPPKKKAPPIARSTATEQVMRNVQKAIEGKDFSSFDDLNAFLATLSGSTMLDARDDVEFSSKDEAQDLAYDAMEAKSEAFSTHFSMPVGIGCCRGLFLLRWHRLLDGPPFRIMFLKIKGAAHPAEDH
jgi:hypothetical protein